MQFYKQSQHAHTQVACQWSSRVTLGTKICGRAGMHINIVVVQQHCWTPNRKIFYRYVHSCQICLTNTNIQAQVFGQKNFLLWLWLQYCTASLYKQYISFCSTAGCPSGSFIVNAALIRAAIWKMTYSHIVCHAENRVGIFFFALAYPQAACCLFGNIKPRLYAMLQARKPTRSKFSPIPLCEQSACQNGMCVCVITILYVTYEILVVQRAYCIGNRA